MLHHLLAAWAISAALVSTPSEASPLFDVGKSLASKTPYYDQTQLNAEVLSRVQDGGSYKLVQVQRVIRHGVQFPSASEATEVQALLTKLQSQSPVTWLTGYKLPYDLSKAAALAPVGRAEMAALGERMRDDLYSSRIPSSFSKADFLLQYTCTSETKASAEAFASTFFTNPREVSYEGRCQNNDPLLRFYDQCARYNRDIKGNATALAELTAYRASPRMAATVDATKAALSLPMGVQLPLTVADVETIYSACAYDMALLGITTNWCSLLSPETIASVELAKDIESYYTLGGGFHLNYEMATALLKDLVATMKDRIAIKGNFRFVQTEAMLPLMTLLGYTDLSPLTGAATVDNTFRTSRLVPFAANIDLRLYEKQGDYYVQIRVNEQIARVPGCGGRAGVFCKLSQVLQLWGYYLTQYDVEAHCTL